MQTVLLVEDNPSAMRAMVKAVRGDRCVVEATTSEEALKALKTQPVDVVVTDMALRSPGHDTEGFNLLSEARSLDIPVIVVSSYLSAERLAEAINGDAFDVIDRGAPNVDFRAMLRHKVAWALRFREAVRLLGASRHEPASTAP